MQAARANDFLKAHRGFLWLVVAYLVVVVAVAALSHLFGPLRLRQPRVLR
jgi:hypothetical protein